MMKFQGWVEEIRNIGSIKFIKLHTVEEDLQITLKKEEVDKQLFDSIDKITRQSAIIVEGDIRENKEAPGGKEIIPKKIEVVGLSEVPLPLDPSGKTPAELETRLDWRFLDFRNRKTVAVYKIQNWIIRAFRDYLIKNNFFEIQPPCIIASASEGGAELFKLQYFEKQAYLAQSPQLYKQMGAISFGKVFCIMPVFRAEKFNKPTHLNEIRQMDVEIAFVESEEDAMKVLEECFVHILETIKENCKRELGILKRELEIPKLPLKRITYEEAVELLKKEGEEIEYGQDFSKLQEQKLGEIVGKAFFIKEWPTELKAFYAMPFENNPKICRAFDLIYEGLEISSGTQRIHIPELLINQLKAKELNPDDFKFYIDCFRFGAPPHAGWSIGLERITMKICGLNNIQEATMFPRTRTRLTP
jgi:nondiscriminating aspartyl-tRNA synthetase